ncbi:MAG: glycosyltransferase family 2 protein [Acidimicrobiales bacterium]
MTVQVILPVRDEVEALGWLLERMPPGYDPIVVDNGSTDGSGAVARGMGARVVDEPQPGFGSACFAGLTAASSDLVCFMDADGSLDPAELPRVVAPLASGRADLVLGTRRALPGAQSLTSRLANRALTWQLARLAGARLGDLGPMRAARREALLALHITDRRFGWPLEMVLRAIQGGWALAEVPVTYSLRQGGRSKVTGTMLGTLRTVKDMTGIMREVRGGAVVEAPA